MSWDQHISPPDSLVNTIIADKYQLLERIGEGGMSVVYKANHLQLNRLVAIKIVQDKHASRDPRSMERFQQEARAASSLTHPNVITVFDFGTTPNGMAYLVMDYLDGEGLDDAIRRGTLKPRRWVHIFEQVCDALTQAHAKGIIHRDIKPSNIMLIDLPERQDFVKIVDFGIAKLVAGTSPDAQQLTQSGEILGSPLYMSPEQCTGQILDIRSDIYSLGCVMYEAFTGKPPIQGENVLAIIYKHIHYTPAEFSAVIPQNQVPPSLESIIHKALKKDPNERWSSTAEMRKAMLAILSDLPTIEEGLLLEPSATQTAPPAERSKVLDTTAKIFLDRLSFAESSHGPESPDLIPFLDQLADYYQRNAYYDEAEETHHRAVRILVNKFGAWSPEVAEAVFSLAEFYQSLGRHHDAEPLLVDLVTIKEKAKGKDKWDLPFVLQCLGDAYKFTGRFSDAEAAYVKSLKSTEKIFGKDDGAVAAALSRLATIYYVQGRYDEAIELYRRLVSLYERLHGPKHESVADALVSLAINYQCARQLEFAETALMRALIIQESALGKDHPDLASTAVFLADLYCSQGNNASAEQLYKRALNVRFSHYGANSLEVAAAYECLGSFYSVVGRTADAEQMYRNGIAIRENVLGSRHPDMALPTRALAMLYEHSGQYKKAEHYYVASLEALQSDDSPELIADTYQALGEVYRLQKKLSEAQAAFERALVITESARGSSHPSLLDGLELLAIVREEMGEIESAMHLRARATAIRQAYGQR